MKRFADRLLSQKRKDPKGRASIRGGRCAVQPAEMFEFGISLSRSKSRGSWGSWDLVCPGVKIGIYTTQFH